MVWLQQQGHTVLGVELSPIAIQAFFAENHAQVKQSKHHQFDQYQADDIRILCGDFFDLSREDMAGVSAVYDRASLVALPPEMRERYANHLVNILPSGTQILLVTFDYPQYEMSGPPFAVSPDEVMSLYSSHARVRKLAEIDVLADNPRFRDRGVSRLQENVFVVTLG